MLLARPLNGTAFSGSSAERRLLSQEDYSISVGGLACDPSLLRTTLSRAAVSGLGGVSRQLLAPTQPAPHLPLVPEASHRAQQQAALARSSQAERCLVGL